ncbi:MAG: hypothetical protein AAGI52_03290 [Bacteroidota bacterium]
MLCLALAVALVLSVSDAPVEYEPAASSESAEPSTAMLPSAPSGPPAIPTAAMADSTSVSLDSLLAAYPTEPQPIPAAMLTQIEDAGTGPLPIEMGQLLTAIQTGFGDRSAQIEPTLRPYVFRIAGRLSVRSDTLRIAATAPDLDLARARAATLRRTLDVAGVSGTRVVIGAGVGPHALTTVSD